MAQAVLNLRSDPSANSMMAGAFTKSNAAKLAARLGRPASEGELYIAHFLGPTGASRLIGLADAKPLTRAASAFPGAARANPTIFYDARGFARNAAEVYRTLVGRYDTARGGPANAPVMADTPAAETSPRNAFAPDTAMLTETYAAAARMSPVVPGADNGPMFHGLFRTGGAAEPLAPVVSALWGSPVAAPQEVAVQPPMPAPPAAPAPPSAADKGELGLFQNQIPDARALFRGRV
jgi:hypothetical protein